MYKKLKANYVCMYVRVYVYLMRNTLSFIYVCMYVWMGVKCIKLLF